MTTSSMITNVKMAALVAALALFSGCKEKQPVKPASASAVVSVEKTSFDAVTAKLDAGGCVYGYLSTEQWLDGLSGKIADCRGFVDAFPNLSEKDQKQIGQVFDIVTNLVKNSGVEEISGVGISSVAWQTNLYRNKLILHHYPGKNAGLLWSVFGKTPHALDGLDLLPANTALAVFGDADLPLVWSTFQAEIARLDNPELSQKIQMLPALFEQQTHLKLDEVLASLGGQYGLILTLDESKPVTIPTGGPNTIEIPDPALALVVKVTNDLVFNAVDKRMSNPQMIKVDTANLKMRTQPVPLPLPIQLRPTIARSGDYLIVASTDALVQEMVDVKTGKKQGWKSTQAYKRLTQGVPTQGNSFVYSGFSLNRALLQIQKSTLGKGQLKPEQSEWLSNLLNGSRAREGFAVGANTAEGWENIGNGSDSLSKTVLFPAMVAPAAMAAAMVVPALAKAREKAQNISQYNQIVNRLRQIDAAKAQWALENKKAAGDEPTEADLAPYLGAGQTKSFIGEKYTINPLDKAPTVKIPVPLKGHPAGSVISLDDLK